MTLTRYALPAGVFLAVACLLAGCGNRPAPRIAGTAAAVQISQPGAVSYFFPATGLEFTAGARFAGTTESLESRAVASCMARSGFHVQAETAAEAAAEAFDNAQFPDLARIARTGLLNPSLAVTGKPAPRPPAARRAAYYSAVSDCEHAAASVLAPMMTAAVGLSAAWLQDVTRIQSSPAVQAEVSGYFTICARQHAVPPSSAGSFGVFLAFVTGQESRARTQIAGLAVDRRWAKVFAWCARPVVQLQERLQSASQAVFLQAHAAQVRALQSAAARAIATTGRSS
jgi:hypothetical protein